MPSEDRELTALKVDIASNAMLFLIGIPTLACAGALHTSYSFTLQTLWLSTSRTHKKHNAAHDVVVVAL